MYADFTTNEVSHWHSGCHLPLWREMRLLMDQLFISNTSGNTWTAVYTANASDTDGAVTYSIAFSDTLAMQAQP